MRGFAEFRFRAGGVYLLPVVVLFCGPVFLWWVGTGLDGPVVPVVVAVFLYLFRVGCEPVILSGGCVCCRWPGLVAGMFSSLLLLSLSCRGFFSDIVACSFLFVCFGQALFCGSVLAGIALVGFVLFLDCFLLCCHDRRVKVFFGAMFPVP